MVLLPAVVACLASVAMPLPYSDPTPEDAVSGRRPDGRFSVSAVTNRRFCPQARQRALAFRFNSKDASLPGDSEWLVGAIIALKRRPHRGGIEYKIRMLKSAARMIVFSR